MSSYPNNLSENKCEAKWIFNYLCPHSELPLPILFVIAEYISLVDKRLFLKRRHCDQICWYEINSKFPSTLFDTLPSSLEYDQICKNPITETFPKECETNVVPLNDGSGRALIFPTTDDEHFMIEPDASFDGILQETSTEKLLVSYSPWNNHFQELCSIPKILLNAYNRVSDACVVGNMIYTLVFSKGNDLVRTVFACDWTNVNSDENKWISLPEVPGLAKWCYYDEGKLFSHRGELYVAMFSTIYKWSPGGAEWILNFTSDDLSTEELDNESWKISSTHEIDKETSKEIPSGIFLTWKRHQDRENDNILFILDEDVKITKSEWNIYWNSIKSTFSFDCDIHVILRDDHYSNHDHGLCLLSAKPLTL